MMITGNRSLVAVILFLVNGLLVAGARPPPSPVTEDTLQEVADSLEMYVDPLPQMPKLFGYSMKDGRPSPGHLTIGMFQKKWKFHRNLPATTVFVYGTSAKTATFPGPTIESLQGTPLSVTWQNHLPNQHILPSDATIPVASPKHGGVPTVVHLHGGIDEPQSDGNSMSWFTSNFSETGPTWSKPTCYYTNIQHPGNLWYHDHTLGLTRINLLAGLIGGYIIRNPTIESPFGLPTGDEFDRQLIIVDRSFNTDGSIYMNATGNNQDTHPQWQPEYFGDAIIVNGKAWPYLTVQRRKYRFRIINASNARFLRLSLSNGLLFHVIGSDSAYLRAPVETWSILAAPAEIYDVVVDFAGSDTAEVELLNGAPYPFPGGDLPDLLNGKVMKFIITDETTVAKDLSTVPAKLVEYPKPSKKVASMRRYIALFEFESPYGEPTHLVINQKRFEDPVTETPRAGSTEVWEVINLTEDDHPLHIHLATFQAVRVRSLVDEDGFKSCMLGKNNARSCNITRHAAGKMVVVPTHERTWKNVVKIAPGHVTTVVVRFALLDRDAPYPFDATAEPGYVYHCHILDHEDNAMMRPLKLIA